MENTTGLIWSIWFIGCFQHRLPPSVGAFGLLRSKKFQNERVTICCVCVFTLLWSYVYWSVLEANTSLHNIAW